MLEDKVIQNELKLLAVSLNGADKNVLPDLTNWQAIKKDLENRCLLSVVSDYVMGTNIAEEEKLYITKQSAITVRAFYKIMADQTKLIEILQTNNIKFAILKGISTAQYYSNPALRQFADIDILVLPKDYRKTFDVLLQNNYKNLNEFDETQVIRHMELVSPNGIEVEVHRHFMSDCKMNNGKNNLLNELLYDALDRTEAVNVCGFTAPTFPKLENGLILLGHIQHHLQGELTLRRLVSWMMYVKAELNDEYWKVFKKKTDELGLTKLAKIITKTCQIYLGLTKNITWCNGISKRDAKMFMEQVLKQESNIDNSDGFSYEVMSFSQMKGIKGFFSYLTQKGVKHMQENGHKPVKAFAWLYQIGYIIKQLAKKKNKKEYFKYIKSAKKKSNFIKKL